MKKGLGVAMVPDLLKEMPKMVQNIFGSAVTMAGLSAILLNTLLPKTGPNVEAKAETHAS